MYTFVAGIWKRDGKKENQLCFFELAFRKVSRFLSERLLKHLLQGREGATRTPAHEGDDYSSHILSTSATESGDCSLPKGQSPDQMTDRPNWIGSSGRRH